MSDFIRKRWYIPLGVVCIIGFAVGFLFKGSVAKAAKADDNVEAVREEGWASDEAFPEEIYLCSYYNDVFEVEMRKNASASFSSDSETYLYTKKDVEMLNKKILGAECKLTRIEDSNGLRFEEYQNGYPTGASSSYVFNDDGYIIGAFFREGKIYDFDGPMIPYEEAYELALKAIPDKYNVENYGFEIDLYESSAESCDYRIYYNPEQEKLCYDIEGFCGVVTGDTTLAGIEVWFDVILAVDGSSVEVASTLTF